jgi:hypothetical protein
MSLAIHVFYLLVKLNDVLTVHILVRVPDSSRVHTHGLPSSKTCISKPLTFTNLTLDGIV